MSGRYPGVIISINKLSVRVSPICLSELVAMLAEVGENVLVFSCKLCVVTCISFK